MDGHTGLAIFQRSHGREIGIESNRCEIKKEESGTEKSTEKSKTEKQEGIEEYSKSGQKNSDKDTFEQRTEDKETRNYGQITESHHRSCCILPHNMENKIE